MIRQTLPKNGRRERLACLKEGLNWTHNQKNNVEEKTWFPEFLALKTGIAKEAVNPTCQQKGPNKELRQRYKCQELEVKKRVKKFIEPVTAVAIVAGIGGLLM